MLGGEDLPVELEYEACNVVTLRVVSATAEAERLVVQLGGKHTDCLAKDVCLPAAGTCQPGSGCC